MEWTGRANAHPKVRGAIFELLDLETNLVKCPSAVHIRSLEIIGDKSEVPKIRTTIPVSHKDLLEGAVNVVLTTVMPDGQPQSTPVWCNLDGNTILIIVTMLVGVQLILNGFRLDSKSSLTAIVIISLALVGVMVQYADYLREIEAKTPLLGSQQTDSSQAFFQSLELDEE